MAYFHKIKQRNKISKTNIKAKLFRLFWGQILFTFYAVSFIHSALLLTSSGQIDVTKWAIGSNDTNCSTSKYKENEEMMNKLYKHKIHS